MDNPLQKMRSSTHCSVIEYLAEPRSITSEQLLGDRGLVVILHQGERYQLRQTKAGKLILTK